MNLTSAVRNCIVLNYKYVMNSTKNEYDYYKSILAHEFIYSINSKLSINSQSNWITESFTVGAEMYYMNEVCNMNPGENFLSTTDSRLEEFYNNSRLLDFEGNENDSFYKYATGFFAFYLIYKYGFQLYIDIISNTANFNDDISAINSVLLEKFNQSFDEVYEEFLIYIANICNKATYFLGDIKDHLLNNFSSLYNNHASHFVDERMLISTSTVIGRYTASFVTVRPIDVNFSLKGNFSNTTVSSKENFYIIKVLKNGDNIIEKFNIAAEKVVEINDFSAANYKYITFICFESTDLQSNLNGTFSSSLELNLEKEYIQENDSLNVYNNLLYSKEDYACIKNVTTSSSLYSFIPSRSDFYEISILGATINEEKIHVYDQNHQYFIRYYQSQYDVPSKTFEKNKNIILFLEKDVIYNILITDISLDQAIPVFLKVGSEFHTNNIDMFNNISYKTPIKKGDNLLKLNFLHNGSFNLDLNFINNKANFTHYARFSIIIKKDDTYQIIDENKLHSLTTFSRTILSVPSYSYYIAIYNVHLPFELEINITPKITKQYSLVTDPNANVSCGSEIILGSHTFNGSTINEGLNRCFYLPDGSISKSRLDYYWYSSNKDVLDVSSYGTGQSKAVNENNTVFVIAVYKLDYSYVAVREITILNDQTEEEISFSVLLDMRNSNPSAGTEVTENGGDVNSNYIHQGFTRLITLTNQAPSFSILDYDWSSFNYLNATVSQYGTITAKNITGPTVIYGTYKYNNRYKCSININVI